MKAYGQTTDMNSGFLRELGGRGTTCAVVFSGAEFGWKDAEQRLSVLAPQTAAEPSQPKTREDTRPFKSSGPRIVV